MLMLMTETSTSSKAGNRLSAKTRKSAIKTIIFTYPILKRPIRFILHTQITFTIVSFRNGKNCRVSKSTCPPFCLFTSDANASKLTHVLEAGNGRAAFVLIVDTCGLRPTEVIWNNVHELGWGSRAFGRRRPNRWIARLKSSVQGRARGQRSRRRVRHGNFQWV